MSSKDLDIKFVVDQYNRLIYLSIPLA